MKGELGIDNSDRIAFAATTLIEAGLRTCSGDEPPPSGCVSVKCEGIDAVEIIAAIENYYNVEFSTDDFIQLYILTERGHIRVDELVQWLRDCEARKNAK